MKRYLTTALLAASLLGCTNDDSDTAAVTADFTLKGVGSTDDAELALATDGMDPFKLEVKLYGFYASKNEDCSDMVEVYTNDAPEYGDMLAGVDFGDAALADGTYKCVAYKVADVLKSGSKEDSTNGGCVKDEEFELEVCRSNLDGEEYAGVHADDTKFTCEEGKEDIVTFYVSTLAASAGGQENNEVEECQAGEGSEGETAACSTFLKPTSEFTRRGIKLTDEIVKAGKMTGFIVIDGTGKIAEQEDNGSYACEMQPPSFGFTAI